jgi:endonuclease/exonuclease/phosphatase family metal-dependent hydrolase
MMKRLLRLLLVVLLSVSSVSYVFAQDGNQKDRDLSVMTRNMDAGSDFGYILVAAAHPNPDPQLAQIQMLTAITQTFYEMVISNFAGRADGIAAEIQATQPYLVGLQEVTTLRTGAYPGHATNVVADNLESLLQSLAQRGLHYQVLKLQKNSDIEMPAFDASYNLITVGFTDYDAVLVRTDLPVSQLKIENVNAQYFSTILNFPVAGQDVPFTRGWISVDAKLRGKDYRFVTTHLETFYNDVQYAQALELLSGPLQTSLPTILAGDLNSDANAPSYLNGPAFGVLIGGGFNDIWGALHPNEAGLTWPNFAEDESTNTTPYQRIDLVLTRGNGVEAESEQLVGTGPINGSELWASDHAGVVATLRLLP